MRSLDSLIGFLDALEAPADLSALRGALGGLRVSRADLAEHVAFEEDHYARNEMARSAWHELVCLCWRPGQGTPIHDHRGSSCAFMIVQGQAEEICYDLDAEGRLAGARAPVAHRCGSICASWDADVHEVVNRTAEDLITLHIYSPALSQMRVYSRDTGVGELWTPHMVVVGVGDRQETGSAPRGVAQAARSR